MWIWNPARISDRNRHPGVNLPDVTETHHSTQTTSGYAALREKAVAVLRAAVVPIVGPEIPLEEHIVVFGGLLQEP